MKLDLTFELFMLIDISNVINLTGSAPNYRRETSLPHMTIILDFKSKIRRITIKSKLSEVRNNTSIPCMQRLKQDYSALSDMMIK